MNTYYKTKDNVVLEVFMWDDFFDNSTIREFAEVTPIYEKTRGKECRMKLFKDDCGVYIIWNEENIYLNDFLCDTVETMSVRLAECVDKKDRWLVSNDEICATFMKDTDNIGLVVDMAAYDIICKPLGIGFVGNNEYTVLCIPTEKLYNKNRWFYRFTAECYCEKLRNLIPSRHFYFSDFCSLLKSGDVRLVHKDKFIKENKGKNSVLISI